MKKAIARWLITGTPIERFCKEAAVMFPIAFCSYCVIFWKEVAAKNFLVEDLWVTAACSALGFGIVAAMSSGPKPTDNVLSDESTLDGVSSS